MERLNDVSNSHQSVVGMNTSIFDIHAAASKLKEHGFAEGQAVATVSMVRNAMNESVATKADIAQLESRMETSESRMKADYAQLESRIKADYAELESRLTNHFYDVAFVIVVTTVGLLAILK